jgi:hypothetical protein
MLYSLAKSPLVAPGPLDPVGQNGRADYVTATKSAVEGMTPLAPSLTESQHPERSEDSDSQVGADDLFFTSSGSCPIDDHAGQGHCKAKREVHTVRGVIISL